MRFALLGMEAEALSLARAGVDSARQRLGYGTSPPRTRPCPAAVWLATAPVDAPPARARPKALLPPPRSALEARIRPVSAPETAEAGTPAPTAAGAGTRAAALAPPAPPDAALEGDASSLSLGPLQLLEVEHHSP